MGLSSVYSLLLLFSVVSLYHASTHICPHGYYCAATDNCKNISYCQQGVCPAGGDISLIPNWTDTCDTGPEVPSGKPVLYFTTSSFSAHEPNEAVELELRLNKPLNCCTVSVKVLVESAATGSQSAEVEKDFQKFENGYVEVVIPAGRIAAKFSVGIVDDDVFEDSESFRIMILDVSVPYGVELGNPRSAAVIITDDDDAIIKFTEEKLEVNEDEGLVNMSIHLVDANGKEMVSSRDVSVEVETVVNTASECDYDNNTRRVTIPAFKRGFSFGINIFDDDVYEFSEIFKAALVKESQRPRPRVAFDSDHDSVSVTIIDNEEPNYVGFDKMVYRVEESDTSVMPVLVLEKPATCCITIRAKLHNYNVTNDSMEVDFGGIKQTFNYTFLTNETRAYPDANITIFHDLHVEHHEAFYICILNQSLPFGVKPRMDLPHGYSSAKSIIVINDNDNYVRFSELGYTVYEDEGPVDITLELHKPALENITIGVRATPITATGSHVDFKGQQFYCTFEPNQRECIISIEIIDDMEIERDEETFRLDIEDSNFPEGFVKENPHTTYITIVDDDYECILSNQTVNVVTEGDSLELPLYLSRLQRTNVAVEYQISPTSTATLGKDFTLFIPEEPIVETGVVTIDTVSDTLIEFDEVIEIRAVIPNDGVICSTTVRIVDDNMCNFNQSVYAVEEGDKVNLFLTFTRALSADVNIKMEYNFSEPMTNEDFSSEPPAHVTLVGGQEVIKITIGTIHDILLEDDESFDVIAYPPSEANISCRTTVTIRDDNTCNFEQQQYNVTEGGHANIRLKIDNPLPAAVFAQIKFDTPLIYLSAFLNRIRIAAGRDNTVFRAFTLPDRRLEHDQIHTITATLPGNRECSTKLRIIDDDTMTLHFRRRQYTLQDKNDVRSHRPVLEVLGMTAFTFNVTVLEIDGTAAGHDEGEPKLMKDFERRSHYIEITPDDTRDGRETYTLPLDIIDDDIVEKREEYYTLDIMEETLPQRVTVGRFFPTTNVVITDDDATTVSVQGSKVKLSKGVYKTIRLRFMFNNVDPKDRHLNATETIMPFPEPKTEVRKILVYMPGELERCNCIHEDDDDNMIMIMYERP